jgi:cell wall-associated NlpC family hydrolase
MYLNGKGKRFKNAVFAILWYHICSGRAMKHLVFYFVLAALCLVYTSCANEPAKEEGEVTEPTVANSETLKQDSLIPYSPASVSIDTKNKTPAEVINFAKTLIGVPYKYGSTDPAQGFDCSGFITYVFNHFNISVPRSSIDFTNVGMEVKLPNALPGDLILFTGTDSTERFVGHMGIVIENIDSLRFIHSTSGKKWGVTITTLNPYYMKRFVKVTRIFNESI